MPKQRIPVRIVISGVMDVYSEEQAKDELNESMYHVIEALEIRNDTYMVSVGEYCRVSFDIPHRDITEIIEKFTHSVLKSTIEADFKEVEQHPPILFDRIKYEEVRENIKKRWQFYVGNRGRILENNGDRQIYDLAKSAMEEIIACMEEAIKRNLQSIKLEEEKV